MLRTHNCVIGNPIVKKNDSLKVHFFYSLTLSLVSESVHVSTQDDSSQCTFETATWCERAHFASEVMTATFADVICSINVQVKKKKNNPSHNCSHAAWEQSDWNREIRTALSFTGGCFTGWCTVSSFADGWILSICTSVLMFTSSVYECVTVCVCALLTVGEGSQGDRG